MSDQGTPQTAEDWQKLWQDKLRYENPVASEYEHGSGTFGLQYRFAGWWPQVIATFIDTLLILLFEAPVFAGAWAIGMGDPLLIASVSGSLPYVWLQWLNGSSGQTAGKRVLHLKVVDQADGYALGGPMGLVRGPTGWAMSALMCGIVGLIDLAWPIFDGKKQTLHDKVVASVVLGGQYMARTD